MASMKATAQKREYLPRLPVAERQIVQLAPGHLDLARIEVRGRDSFVIRLATGARSMWTTVPEADWIGYTIPITWEGDYLLNGMSATRTSVFRLDGSNEYDVVAESRDFFTCGIRRSVLSRAISGLIGRDLTISVEMHRQLHVPDAHRAKLLGILLKSLAWAPPSGADASFGRLPRSVEVAMIETIADWTIATDQLSSSEKVDRKSELRIVRDSLRKIREVDCSVLAVADLCRMAGVAKSRLHQAFSEIYGISPGAYLHRLRLTSIREKLLSEEAPPRSIKDVAIEHGFLSSGQFARAYRDMFGELPSQTLRTTKS
jgi:AraC-like DNA-binding protein